MESANEGGVNLDDYRDLGTIRSHSSTWEQIRGVIRADAMPPPDATPIGPEDKLAIMQWIQSALHDVDCDCEPAIPKVTLRRLNQAEYDNTVSDLLGIDLKASKDIGFVSDDVGNGFDNQGEVLSLPPLMLEKYMQAAVLISKRTIELDREAFRRQRFDGAKIRFSESSEQVLHLAQGKYQINVRMRFGDKQPDKCKVKIHLDGMVVQEYELESKDENYKFDAELNQGDHLLRIEYADDSEPEKRNDAARRVIVDNIRVNGPENGKPAFPAVHERIVIAHPEQKDTPEGMPIGLAEASRRVFTKLLPRAYRRPVSEEEIQSVVIVCEKASEAGFGYEESIRFGLQAVLVSPSFLFRSELVEPEQGLDAYGLATRMSYFLWSSMPDETLFALAENGRIREPAVIKEQVTRMLDSPKANALLKGFFAQWLGLRKLNKIEIDRQKYPQWNERLMAAMVKETELFCQHVLRNGSVGDFTDANYSYVNPRLAEYYGLEFEGKDPATMYKRTPGKQGKSERRQGLYDDEEKWIRVELSNNRKGLITHASVLALTSNPTRTSPVKRGKWILENVLGDPPPSAPPNVPSLDQGEHKADASLRERLEIHRSNPSCAGCHKLMDPIGLGLENFDAIGRWREKDGETPIDAKGQLADGRNFEGPTELVTLLSDKKPQMMENFATRMLTYALGRGLQRQDKCDIDRIISTANQNSQSIRSIVESIILSDAFLQKNTSTVRKLSDAN